MIFYFLNFTIVHKVFTTVIVLCLHTFMSVCKKEEKILAFRNWVHKLWIHCTTSLQPPHCTYLCTISLVTMIEWKLQPTLYLDWQKWTWTTVYDHIVHFSEMPQIDDSEINLIKFFPLNIHTRSWLSSQ